MQKSGLVLLRWDTLLSRTVCLTITFNIGYCLLEGLFYIPCWGTRRISTSDGTSLKDFLHFLMRYPDKFQHRMLPPWRVILHSLLRYPTSFNLGCYLLKGLFYIPCWDTLVLRTISLTTTFSIECCLLGGLFCIPCWDIRRVSTSDAASLKDCSTLPVEIPRWVSS